MRGKWVWALVFVGAVSTGAVEAEARPGTQLARSQSTVLGDTYRFEFTGGVATSPFRPNAPLMVYGFAAGRRFHLGRGAFSWEVLASIVRRDQRFSGMLGDDRLSGAWAESDFMLLNRLVYKIPRNRWSLFLEVGTGVTDRTEELHATLGRARAFDDSWKLNWSAGVGALYQVADPIDFFARAELSPGYEPDLLAHRTGAFEAQTVRASVMMGLRFRF